MRRRAPAAASYMSAPDTPNQHARTAPSPSPSTTATGTGAGAGAAAAGWVGNGPVGPPGRAGQCLRSVVDQDVQLGQRLDQHRAERFNGREVAQLQVVQPDGRMDVHRASEA